MLSEIRCNAATTAAKSIAQMASQIFDGVCLVRDVPFQWREHCGSFLSRAGNNASVM